MFYVQPLKLLPSSAFTILSTSLPLNSWAIILSRIQRRFFWQLSGNYYLIRFSSKNDWHLHSTSLLSNAIILTFFLVSFFQIILLWSTETWNSSVLFKEYIPTFFCFQFLSEIMVKNPRKTCFLQHVEITPFLFLANISGRKTTTKKKGHTHLFKSHLEIFSSAGVCAEKLRSFNII